MEVVPPQSSHFTCSPRTYANGNGSCGFTAAWLLTVWSVGRERTVWSDHVSRSVGACISGLQPHCDGLTCVFTGTMEHDIWSCQPER